MRYVKEFETLDTEVKKELFRLVHNIACYSTHLENVLNEITKLLVIIMEIGDEIEMRGWILRIADVCAQFCRSAAFVLKESAGVFMQYKSEGDEKLTAHLLAILRLARKVE
jgi:predicted acetyltransferase